MSVKHKTIMGSTGTGKSVYAIHKMNQEKHAVLFFNTKLMRMPRNWVTAREDNTLSSFQTAIKQRMKINFIPSRSGKKVKKQLDWLWYFLSSCSLKEKLIIAVDECAIVAPQGSHTAAAQIAIMGRGLNIEGWFIMQRFADADKKLLTQSDQLYIFDHSEYDTPYIKKYLYPDAEGMLNTIRAAGKHHYVTLSRGTISKPQKETIPKSILTLNP